MESEICNFLTKFNKIKSELKNTPSNLSWLVKERESLKELCLELESSYLLLKKSICFNDSKSFFIDAPIEDKIKEYEQYYAKCVTEAAKELRDRNTANMAEYLFTGLKDKCLEAGYTEEEYEEGLAKNLFYMRLFETFNPMTHNPAEFIEEHRELLCHVIHKNLFDKIGLPREVYEERFGIAFGSWEFFTETIGVNFGDIYDRWKSAPELFLQRHVAQTEESPIVKLYDQSVRAYVFGSNVACIAICRSLMEHVLKHHYLATGIDLKEIIIEAERKYPQLKKLKLQEKRLLSNGMLHNYELGKNIENDVVVSYLRAIKFLVEGIPQKKSYR